MYCKKIKSEEVYLEDIFSIFPLEFPKFKHFDYIVFGYFFHNSNVIISLNFVPFYILCRLKLIYKPLIGLKLKLMNLRGYIFQ